MKKSELRYIIKESLKEIMGEEKSNEVEIIKKNVEKTGELIKPEVKNELQRISTDLEARKEEIYTYVKATYDPKLIGALLLMAPMLPIAGLANMTSDKGKVRSWKKVIGHKVIMGVALAMGLYDNFFRYETIAKVLPGESMDFFDRVAFDKPWFKSAVFDDKTIHEKVFHDGEPFITIAIVMFILRILLEGRERFVPEAPKKPGIFKRAATGVKDMFREEVEGTDEIIDQTMAMIDNFTDGILDIIDKQTN
tara:strand:+ start:108 stop:860 length:753 start_codon:yes stop_codon:yes gene_type:complete